MDRTDIHRPSAIVPADYEFVCFEYLRIETLQDCAVIQSERAIKTAHFARTGGTYATHEHGGSCHVCGASAVYTVLFYHAGTNEYIRTGQDCAQKMEMPYDEWRYNAYRKGITDARLAQAGKRKAEAILTDKGFQKAWAYYIEPEQVVTATYQYEEKTIVDIVGKLVRYGSTSDRALNYIGVLLTKISKRAEVEARRAEEAAKAADCPTGRVTVKGEVLSTRVQDGPYGRTVKMLVKDATGFKVWGTMPSSLSVERGAIVKFSAAVEPSKDDVKFGYFSRPTKAEEVVVNSPAIPEADFGLSAEELAFEPTIHVNCTKCGMDYDEKTVEILDIEEGIQGEDILTFTCPEGHPCKSVRRG